MSKSETFIFSTEEQPLKQYPPNLVAELTSRSIDLIPLHSLKASESIFSTESGMEIYSSFSQPAKAYDPIEVGEFENDTDSRPVQFLNAANSIETVDSEQGVF